MDQQTVQEGKTIAIISYITLIGTVIAFVMNLVQVQERTGVAMRFAKRVMNMIMMWIGGFSPP